jgi:hypothetical protein
MTREDTRIIFGNIAELAVFSDMFCERLEEALGCIVEEGKREDHVGELFLEIVRFNFYCGFSPTRIYLDTTDTIDGAALHGLYYTSFRRS